MAAGSAATLALSGVSLTSIALAGAAQAGPMQCTTTLEAPILGVREASGAVVAPPAPVELTRCEPVETIPQLYQRRAYTWTAPYAQGVNLVHQVTDILGIAVAGRSGNQVMGFGFPDQTLVWDGTAIENTYQAQLQLMAQPMPWRTADLDSVFTTSLGNAALPAAPSYGSSWNRSVRGMW